MRAALGHARALVRRVSRLGLAGVCVLVALACEGTPEGNAGAGIDATDVADTIDADTAATVDSAETNGADIGGAETRASADADDTTAPTDGSSGGDAADSATTGDATTPDDGEDGVTAEDAGADAAEDGESDDVGADGDAEDAADDTEDTADDADDTLDAADDDADGDSSDAALEDAVDDGGDAADGGDAEDAAADGAGDGEGDAGDAAAETTQTDVMTGPDGGPLVIEPESLPQTPLADITGDFPLSQMPNHGPCLAAADFDGDGYEDFAVVRLDAGQPTIRAILLKKTGAQQVISSFDATTSDPSFGCSAADFNGDNKPDLVFGGLSGAALYLGDGKGGFKDATAQWLPYFMFFQAFSVQPADLDGDGDLDLFVGSGFAPPSCTALKCQFTSSDLLCTLDPPLPETPQLQDRVLIQGDKLPMVDATTTWKVPGGGNQTVVMALDVDEDGKMDMLVGDDMGQHRLLHNEGGTFSSYSDKIGFHPYAGAMGWAVGDLNLDGLMDLVLAESGPTPVYAGSDPKGAPAGLPVAPFIDIGGLMGVWWTTWGASAWSPIVADLDQDGRDDLLLGVTANFSYDKAATFGAVCIESQQDPSFNPFAGTPSLDLLYLHEQPDKWTAYKLPAGPAPHVVFLDQKAIDVDHDGDLDIVQTRPGTSSLGSIVRVLRNDLPKKGGAFQVRVQGKGKNQDALGSVVRATIGGKEIRRYLNGSGGFGGNPARIAHFGLGSGGIAKDVRVRWPDGKESKLGDATDGTLLQATWP
ncbi:MAG: hypothetical protein RIT45_418 [Pseudomonadota bacterium]|jgi:hypothetical protein